MVNPAECQVDGILFDMDGTLIESFDAWYHLLNQACVEFGHPPIDRDHYKGIYGCGMATLIDEYMVGTPLEDLDKYCQENFGKYTDHIIILDRAPEVVAASLAYTNGRSFVVTNCPRYVFDQIVEGTKIKFLKEQFGLHRMICSGDSLPDGTIVKSKPNAHMLEVAASKLGVDVTKCMMVGDSRFDIGAGKNANCVLTVGINVDGGEIKLNAIAELLSIITEQLPKKSNDQN